MTPEIIKLIKKAKESLKAANKLFDDGFYSFSASRAYYAMFYMAEALLLKKELSFSKHSGVISVFGEHFIKTGVIDSKYHQMLRDAFRVRNIGDYAYDVDITKQEARNILKNAENFIGEIEKNLSRKSK